MTSTLQLESHSPARTEHLGRLLGAVLEPGDIIGLVGDLGAGKTALTRAIARGAGVPENVPVNSPTFTILNLYDAPALQVAHLDLYRLGDAEELEGIGLPDLLTGDRVLVVEWFDLFPTAFPADLLIINMCARGERERTLRLEAHGPHSAELLDQFSERAGHG